MQSAEQTADFSGIFGLSGRNFDRLQRSVAADVAHEQVEQRPRINRIVFAMLGLAVDQNGAWIDDDAAKAAIFEPTGEPEAVAAGLLKRVNGRIGGQAKMRLRMIDFCNQRDLALGQILTVNFDFSPTLAAVTHAQVPRITAHIDGDGQTAVAVIRSVAGGALGHGELFGDAPFRHKIGPRALVWISLAQTPLFFRFCDRPIAGRGLQCFPRWMPKGEEPFALS